MISVIMPVWNGARYLDRAIASVVAQTSPAWELLVVDDGSTDDSLARVHRWRDLVNGHAEEEKIRVFSTGKPNSGPQVGRNLAATQGRHDILAFLDQDDLYFPRRVEALLPFFGACDLVFSPYEILEKGRLTLWNLRALWERQAVVCDSEGSREPPFEEWIGACVQRANLSVPLGAAVRRVAYEAVGGFQPGIVSGADGVLWRRMVDRGARIGFCPVVAGRYLVRPDSQARTQRPFSTGAHQMQKDHPRGSNGQYLDAEWFSALEQRKEAPSA